MPESASSLIRFLRRVHRRMLVMRLLEGLGLGILGGSVLAAILYGAAIYMQHAPAGIPWLMLIGALAGLIWAILRLPTILASAMEADRQLNLADLLSSAWAIRGHDRADPQFAATVLALANHHCARLSPSAVIVHRLGGRTWGSIGLSAALVLTLALFSADPLESSASSSTIRSASTRSLALRQSPISSQVNAQTGRSAAISPDHPRGTDEEPDPSRDGVTESTDARTSSHSQNTANPDGAGGGAGTSKTSSPNDPASSSSADASMANGTGSDTGSGGTANGATGRGPNTGLSATSSQPKPPPPVWRSASWPAARAAAESAANSGQIPAEYRDLVREYFTR